MDARDSGVTMDTGVPPSESSDVRPDVPVARDAGADVYIPPLDPCNPTCGDRELCGEDGYGNGLDDDCDGSVDEVCPCSAVNLTKPCFAGPPERRDIGACADGIETCGEFLTWGRCVGGVSPSAEVCDGADNDCDGSRDEELPGCASALSCPSSQSAPPLASYALDGPSVYAGAAITWAWSVECPPTVPPELCPEPVDPATATTQVYFTASGAYRVNVQIMTADSETLVCGWTVYVRGDGLRVELNWDTLPDTRGGTDIDLHLHRWTRNGVDADWWTGDDCYYGNCTPHGDISWTGHWDTDISYCENAPHGGGDLWRRYGACRNPRLDIDTNGGVSCDASVTDPDDGDFCAPENINVDRPLYGKPYRVLVNFYNEHSGPTSTNASVVIYCGGALRASFGLDPFVTIRSRGSSGFANDMWYVADVVYYEGLCGNDCMVYPIGVIAYGTQEFGLPWSCDYEPTTASCTTP